jgi:transcriptional regulator with XRE-family HTH domain
MTREAPPAFLHTILAGEMLDALRRESGKTQTALANDARLSQGVLSRYVRGELNPSKVACTALSKALSSTPLSERKAFLKRAELGRVKPPRSHLRWQYDDEEMRKVVDLDQSAPWSGMHTTMNLPGVLMTEALMRQRYKSANPAKPQDEIDREIALRLRRQAVLDNDDQEFCFLIDQTGLNKVGDQGLLEGQVEHLTEMSKRPNITIRVIPDSVGYYRAHDTCYSLYRYEEERQIHVVYVETSARLDVRHDGETTDEYRAAWDEQLKVALDPDATRTFFEGLVGMSGRRS